MATFNFHVEEVTAAIQTAAMAGVIDGAEMVREEAIRSMVQDPKSGVHYRGNPNRSSAPGESPARQTGALIASIEVFADAPRLAARVNAGSDHAAAMEFGTENIAPRPFLRPALARMAPAISTGIAERIADAIIGGRTAPRR